MRVLLCGIDGYIGWPLALHLASRGHEVYGIDNFSRRRNVRGIGSWSAIPIKPMNYRLEAARKLKGVGISFSRADMLDYGSLRRVVSGASPDAIVHLAEQSSAPFSMIGRKHAAYTQHNNVIGTLNLLYAMKEASPKAHLVKLGTLGEYGCYDDQTEILTENGWKFFSELTHGDKVATRSVGDRTLTFKKPNSINSYDYDGRLYYQTSRSIDLAVTPNHRMFLVQRSGSTYGRLKEESTEQIRGKSRVYDTGFDWLGRERDFRLPSCQKEVGGKKIDRNMLAIAAEEYLEGDNSLASTAGKYAVNRGTLWLHAKKVESGARLPEVQFIPEKRIAVGIWVDFLGWYLAEGSAPVEAGRPSPYKVTIAQRTDNLGAVLPCVTALCKTLGLRYSISRWHEMSKVIIYGKQLAIYLARFGDAYSKHIPEEQKDLPKRFLRRLLSGLLQGDGWKHGRGYRFFSVSERLADDVQEIALKCGYRAIKGMKDNGFTVGISPNPHVNVNHSKPTDGYMDYRGRVYCVNVGGDGIVYVRRNGRPVWCGNTPAIDIPEGFFEVTYQGRSATLPFPRQPGSIYHLSKVHDSANIYFACSVWGLRSTDIMQGVVYGVKTPDITDDSLATRFDFDHVWGTALNRYCAQAVINYPLTPYGAGGQTRGFIALADSIKCLTLVLEHPPEKGQYRVLNQFDKTYSVRELAHKVKEAADRIGMHVSIGRIRDPRVELQEHYYNVEGEGLRRMGFRPRRTIEEELGEILSVLSKHKSRIAAKQDKIAPTIKWKNNRKD